MNVHDCRNRQRTCDALQIVDAARRFLPTGLNNDFRPTTSQGTFTDGGTLDWNIGTVASERNGNVGPLCDFRRFQYKRERPITNTATVTSALMFHSTDRNLANNSSSVSYPWSSVRVRGWGGRGRWWRWWRRNADRGNCDCKIRGQCRIRAWGSHDPLRCSRFPHLAPLHSLGVNATDTLPAGSYVCFRNHILPESYNASFGFLESRDDRSNGTAMQRLPLPLLCPRALRRGNNHEHGDRWRIVNAVNDPNTQNNTARVYRLPLPAEASGGGGGGGGGKVLGTSTSTGNLSV